MPARRKKTSGTGWDLIAAGRSVAPPSSAEGPIASVRILIAFIDFTMTSDTHLPLIYLFYIFKLKSIHLFDVVFW